MLWLLDVGLLRLYGGYVPLRLPTVIFSTIVYLICRTWLAWKDPVWLKWEYHFPPIDVVIITALIYLSHTGPIGNLSILFILPIISAANSLDVRWSAAVGVMVVVGTALTTLSGPDVALRPEYDSLRDLLRGEPVSAAFRVVFILALSSLMAIQAASIASLKERLAVAADRNRIAMDMHDGVQGHLIALAQLTELLSKVAEQNPSRAVELAREGRETTRRAADELRFLVQRLRAPALEQGFVAALRQYAHNITSRAQLALEFEVGGVETSLDPEVENALFRIAQEALSNVVKHAGATTIWLTIEFGRETRLCIRDNGTGFKATASDGVGLDGMMARAGEMGGSVTIDGANGTEVVAILPAGPRPD